MIFEGSREEFFPELMAWAQESGASCEGVEIANFAGEGFGLRATKDIKVGPYNWTDSVPGSSCQGETSPGSFSLKGHFTRDLPLVYSHYCINNIRFLS